MTIIHQDRLYRSLYRYRVRVPIYFLDLDVSLPDVSDQDISAPNILDQDV